MGESIMGLDTSHNCWHGGYGSFNAWRNKLAELAGYPLVKDEGHMVPSNIAWNSITSEHLNGEWESIPSDPLLILICHYDCEGKIDKAHTKILAERLVELLPLMKDFEENQFFEGKTLQFINGLLEAHANKEDVEFH